MVVVITQRCGHRRNLDVPEEETAKAYLIAKWSAKICERCLWKQIAPGTPFPDVPTDIDVRPPEDRDGP